MNKFKRSDRVSHTIHRAISSIIENDLQDKRIGMVTVTGVELARDLKNARVYVSVLGDEKDVELSINILNKASRFIRSRISEKVVLKYIPAIKFYYDFSTVNGMHINTLFKKIHKES